MSDNKFIEHLKGKTTTKSVLEIDNEVANTSFANMPVGTSNAINVYSDTRGDATAVLKGSEIWKLNNNQLVKVTSANGDGRDFTSTYTVFGNTTWVDAVYTFDRKAVFTGATKWVLKLCGFGLLSNISDVISFSLLLKFNNSPIITKSFTVRESAFEFCKEFVVDFNESEQTAIKMDNTDTLTVQLLCSDATASATIYNGMTTLIALQRRVDADAVSSDTRTLAELEEDFEEFMSDTETALNGKVNIDGTSIMTAPLKFMSGSVRGAVGPYFNGVGFWKLDSQANLTQIASISDSQFIPTTTSAIDIGNSTKKWKDLYLAGKAYVGTINNGDDISVPAYAGTMVVAEWGRTVQEGQMLLLDRRLQPVWKFASTYMSFSSDWRTNRTTMEFCGIVASDDSAIAGNAYLGEVTFTDLPSGLISAEVVVEIMSGTDPRNKVIVLRMTSGNQEPYQWQYTYWNGGQNVSGWIGFQPELPSQTGNSGKFLMTNGSGLSWATVDALPTQTGHAGEYLTTDGSSASWAAINAGSGYHPDLFDWKWADHILNDVQWLRADTFSWQSGSVYEAAFWDLFYDMQISTYWYLADVGPAYTKSRTPAVGDAVYLNSNLTGQIGTVATYDDVNDAITVGAHTYTFMSNTYVTPTTETVAGYTLTVYTGHSGKKIVGQVDEADVASIYNATGVAWYYVIDLNNKRFKLPRTKFGVTGLRDTVGNYVAPGLPNITGSITVTGDTNVSGTGVFNSTSGNRNHDIGGGGGVYSASTAGFDASASNSIYGNSTTVQPPATQMYLYFYVGEFTQTALENTAGITAETLNDKVDLDAGNLSNTGKSLIAGLGMPSDTYDELTLGATGTQYTAPANGYYVINMGSVPSLKFITIKNTTKGYQVTNHSGGVQFQIDMALGVCKGDIVEMVYNATGTTLFRFYYAVGSESEAN